jgi:hypothetical protein
MGMVGVEGGRASKAGGVVEIHRISFPHYRPPNV